MNSRAPSERGHQKNRLIRDTLERITSGGSLEIVESLLSIDFNRRTGQEAIPFMLVDKRKSDYDDLVAEYGLDQVGEVLVEMKIEAIKRARDLQREDGLRARADQVADLVGQFRDSMLTDELLAILRDNPDLVEYLLKLERRFKPLPGAISEAAKIELDRSVSNREEIMRIVIETAKQARKAKE